MIRIRMGPSYVICLMICLMSIPQWGLCEDSFYQGYLIQRMRLAALRIQNGESSAEGLMADLVMEAKKAGMEVPAWAASGSPPPSMSRPPANEKTGMKSADFDPLIRDAASAHRLPTALIKAVIKAESDFVADAVSHKGAQGLMQLMPGTADDIGVENAFDPRANILGGAMLLRKYLDEFRSLKKTLIAYNAGPEWVRRKRGVPAETKRYIRNVIRFYQGY
jgi:soluble lytic murein transglycosylase-like protein